MNDPQTELYDRFVRRGESVDAFSAKRLYPGLSSTEAAERIKRLRAAWNEPSCTCGGIDAVPHATDHKPDCMVVG